VSYVHHSAARSQFNDPADYDSASFEHHPVEDLEPIDTTTSDYRAVAMRMIILLDTVDWRMQRCQDPRKTWIAFAIFAGLHSVAGRTLTSIANEMGVTKQALSRDVTLFARVTGLPPAFGLKSAAARHTYMKTNGHAAPDDLALSAQSDA
jgi:hypothetical protein